MTGTVLTLASAGHAGTIRSMDGSRLLFTATAVLGDPEALAIGQHVSFDIEHDGARRRAVRVFHEPVRRTVPARRQDGGPDLRFAGFLNAAGKRVYRFHLMTVGEAVEHSVALDMKLLLKHRVGMQEVPALCAIKLAADLKTGSDSRQHQLEEDDLLQFTAARTAALQRKAAGRHSFQVRRGAAPPGPVLHKPVG